MDSLIKLIICPFYLANSKNLPSSDIVSLLDFDCYLFHINFLKKIHKKENKIKKIAKKYLKQ
jgi:hypothetical protein